MNKYHLSDTITETVAGALYCTNGTGTAHLEINDKMGKKKYEKKKKQKQPVHQLTG